MSGGRITPIRPDAPERAQLHRTLGRKGRKELIATGLELTAPLLDRIRVAMRDQ